MSDERAGTGKVAGTRSVDTVRAYYDRLVEDEWRRLDDSWLEFAVTCHFIDRFVPASAAVLDIGGGPGRYANLLAARGHDVDLADLSPAAIAFAQSRMAEGESRLGSARVADARDLAGFDDDSYDAVLNLGPMYHLSGEADRTAAVRESLRVLKPGGLCFFAFLSRFAPIYFNLKTAPGGFVESRPVIDQILKTGNYRPDGKTPFFVDAYFATPEEIAPFMNRFPLDTVCLFGAEGVMAQSEARLRDLPEAVRDAWRELAIETATTEAALYSSEHLVFVGRKTKR